ncbi:unnamed protein product [Amoebophrya sp. A120]|nr:unnamed protein product [Amoebophrya sp. A120]|eukprot:GSA120T00020727001.1
MVTHDNSSDKHAKWRQRYMESNSSEHTRSQLRNELFQEVANNRKQMLQQARERARGGGGGAAAAATTTLGGSFISTKAPAFGAAAGASPAAPPGFGTSNIGSVSNGNDPDPPFSGGSSSFSTHNAFAGATASGMTFAPFGSAGTFAPAATTGAAAAPVGAAFNTFTAKNHQSNTQHQQSVEVFALHPSPPPPSTSTFQLKQDFQKEVQTLCPGYIWTPADEKHFLESVLPDLEHAIEEDECWKLEEQQELRRNHEEFLIKEHEREQELLYIQDQLAAEEMELLEQADSWVGDDDEITGEDDAEEQEFIPCPVCNVGNMVIRTGSCAPSLNLEFKAVTPLEGEIMTSKNKEGSSWWLHCAEKKNRRNRAQNLVPNAAVLTLSVPEVDESSAATPCSLRTHGMCIDHLANLVGGGGSNATGTLEEEPSKKTQLRELIRDQLQDAILQHRRYCANNYGGITSNGAKADSSGASFQYEPANQPPMFAPMAQLYRCDPAIGYKQLVF